jgi:heme/copper-type cytochrome/quinol oxidase subunit 2
MPHSDPNRDHSRSNAFSSSTSCASSASRATSIIFLAALSFWLPSAQAQSRLQPQPEPRLIEILADHDSRFKVSGQEKSVINLTAGEEIRLRITAVKAKNRNRDGSIHGFTLLHAKNRVVVPGWDFLLQPGVQEFLVTAPAEPGEYQVVCTVICSSGHEQMNMKVFVVSKGG